jgi:hypothetical protein
MECETNIGASLPCGHLGGYAVADSVVVLFTVGACGFCHLSAPVGGAAYRIPMIVSLFIKGRSMSSTLG